MPHQRERYLTDSIKKALKHSPIVGIFGQRQSGKTTLVHHSANEYATFDRTADITASDNDPEQFIRNRTTPFAIDECQLSPRLFPALKEFVRTNPSKGQFILTGSIRFTSRRAIRESLTGRIYSLELLPFNISEANHLPLSDTCLRAVKGDYPKKSRLSKSDFSSFLTNGGLPGICFSRNAHIRNNNFESHLDTLLERDLRLLYSTRLNYQTLRNLLMVLAMNQGTPLDMASISRKTRLNPRTLKELLRYFESMFLLRTIPVEGGQRHPSLFLEDQGLASFLIGKPLTPYENLVRGLYANIRHEFHYRPELNSRYFQYRTRGGADIPLAWHTSHGTLGIAPCIESTATASAVKSAQSFTKNYPHAHVLILHSGTEYRKISDQIAMTPFESVL